MSKYVKNLITDYVRGRLEGRQRRGVGQRDRTWSPKRHALRAELRAKNIQLLVVKNSLAARAMAGTPLAPMFEGVARLGGRLLGTDDIVSLAKEVTRLVQVEEYENVGAARGRDGWLAALRRAGGRSQQVAKPGRADQHFGGPDSRSGCSTGGAACGTGRGAGQPDRGKGQGSRRGAGEAARSRPEWWSRKQRHQEGAASRARPAEPLRVGEPESSPEEIYLAILKRGCVSFASQAALRQESDAEESERIDSEMATDVAVREFSAVTKELGDKIVSLRSSRPKNSAITWKTSMESRRLRAAW